MKKPVRVCRTCKAPLPERAATIEATIGDYCSVRCYTERPKLKVVKTP